MKASRARLAFHLYAAAAVAGLWMLTQPYSGLRHDAVLYLAQALKWSRPEQFSQDLFFAFGSQDSYSVYSLIFGPIFKYGEVGTVQPAVIAICHAAFLAAIWRLLPTQLSLRQRWLSMAALVLLRPLYGGLSIVGYCEPFLTARTVAEPVVLWSFVLFHRHGGVALAWLLMLLALSVHPLMSAPAAVCLWLMCCASNRRWLILLPLTLATISTLTFLGQPPFDALLKQYSDDWWKLVTANDQVLVKNWRGSDWAAIAADFAVLIGAWTLYRPSQRRLIPALIIGIVALLALTVLGSQFHRNVLITQLQLWRGLWMIRALAVALTPLLLIVIARKGRAGPATAYSLACVLGMANLHWESAWIGMAWPALHLWIWRTDRDVSPVLLKASAITSVVSILAMSCFDYFRQAAIPADDAIFMDFSPIGIALIVSPFVALTFMTWLWRAHWRNGFVVSKSTLAHALPASALVLLLTGAALWDRRPPLVRYLESHLHGPHPFEASVPADAAVYWDNNLAAAWFILKRQSYFSPAQGAGVLFNEATAHAWGHRHDVFRAIENRRDSCELFTILLNRLPEGSPACHSLPESEVQAACRLAPDLRFIVSAEPYSRKPVAVWHVPDGRPPFQTQYLYACSSFR